MSQFIIATNNASAVQGNAVTELMKSKGWGFWHHFEDFWMIATQENDHTTSEQLFNELCNIPGIGKDTYIIVIRLPQPGQPMTHFGFGPKQGWEWTKQHWGSAG